MKIAILSPFYPFRAMAQFSERLYAELNKTHQLKAYSFSTLYPKLLFPGTSQYIADEDNTSKVESCRILNSVNPFSYFKTAKKINDYSPDILIIIYWTPYLAPALGSVARLIKKRTKIVALAHNALPHEKSIIDLPLGKYFFKACDAFISLSSAVKSDLSSLVGNNKKILAGFHPIYDHYSPKIDRSVACDKLQINPDRKNLLFFGLIREYKGLDLLIQAFSQLGDSYQLIIAGEAYGGFESYQKLIDESPSSKNIKVVNEYITDQQVSEFFSVADALILPYRSATQSGVVAISYQLETPIVTTNVGELGKMVETGKTGCVANATNPNAIADAIKEFFQLDRTELIQNLQKEKARLSWANFSQSVTDFIARI